jgi:hypothetical protein
MASAAIVSLNSVNRLVVVMATDCVSCEVRTELYIFFLVIKIAVKVTKISFQNYTSPLIQKIIPPQPLSQAAASNYPNAFTSTLPYQKDDRGSQGAL